MEGDAATGTTYYAAIKWPLHASRSEIIAAADSGLQQMLDKLATELCVPHDRLTAMLESAIDSLDWIDWPVNG